MYLSYAMQYPLSDRQAEEASRARLRNGLQRGVWRGFSPEKHRTDRPHFAEYPIS